MSLQQLQQTRPEWLLSRRLTFYGACQGNFKESILAVSHRWETPEFIAPSLNAYYRVPCGSHSCFGDQAAVVLASRACVTSE